jgi:hypothetical protein
MSEPAEISPNQYQNTTKLAEKPPESAKTGQTLLLNIETPRKLTRKL